MEPSVLEDIQAVERLQDEDILMANAGYSATRHYAECLYKSLAAWNAKQRIYLVTDDLNSIAQWRVDVINGVTRREWNPVLRKYWPFVWGSQGYGLIAETGDAAGDAPISFWERPETSDLMVPVLLEATAMAAHLQARGPSGDFVFVARMGGNEAALSGELGEAFCRFSRKARATVEREVRSRGLAIEEDPRGSSEQDGFIRLPDPIRHRLDNSAKKVASEFNGVLAIYEPESHLHVVPGEMLQKVKDRLIEQGRLKGHDEILACEKSRAEVKRLEEELDKPHMRMGRDQWEKSVFGEVTKKEQDAGLKGAVRLTVREKWVIDGAKHFKTFGSDGEGDPTFEALLQSFKRSKEKPKAKKTKQKPRPKRRICDLADDGVRVDLPKETYRE